MVPGAKCQAQGKDGLWLDAVILAHQLAEVPPSHHSIGSLSLSLSLDLRYWSC